MRALKINLYKDIYFIAKRWSGPGLDTVYNWNCHLSPGNWQLQERRILTKLKYKQNHATLEPAEKVLTAAGVQFNNSMDWLPRLTLNQLNWLRQIWLSSQSHDQWSALIGIDNAAKNNIDILLNWELWFQNYYNNISSFI